MTPFVIALLTLALGPAMFSFFSYVVYKREPHKKYPTGITDAVGDVILLPAFNAIVFSSGITFTPAGTVIAAVLALLVTAWFLVYRKDRAEHNDWSRPAKHCFNAGGWYHLAFFAVQSFIIFAGLLSLYANLLIWLPVGGFLLLAIYRFAVQIPKLK